MFYFASVCILILPIWWYYNTNGRQMDANRGKRKSTDMKKSNGRERKQAEAK